MALEERHLARRRGSSEEQRGFLAHKLFVDEDVLIDSEMSDNLAVTKILDDIGDSMVLVRHILILGFAVSVDSVEITAFGYILNLILIPKPARSLESDIVDDDIQFELLSHNSFWSGILSAGVFAGMFLGGLFGGYLSDQFGRKRMLLICMGLNFLGAIFSSMTLCLPFSLQVKWLLVARILCGIGVGGTMPAVFTLVTEISPSYRVAQVVNAVSSFFVLGNLFTGVVALNMLTQDAAIIAQDNLTYFHREGKAQSWPLFALIAGAPTALSFILIFFFIFESPKFLAENERYNEAKTILTACLKSRLGSVSKAATSQDSINAQIDALAENCQKRSIIESKASPFSPSSFSRTLTKIIRGPLRKYVFIVSIVFLTLSFASYGLLTWMTQLFVMLGFEMNPYSPSLLLALASAPGNLGALYFVTIVKAKRLLLICLSLCSFSLLVFGVVYANKTLAVLAGACFHCFSSATWNTLGAVSSECFPDKVRSFCFGLTASIGRIGGILANVINGVLFNNASVGFILVFNSAIVAIGAVASFSL